MWATWLGLTSRVAADRSGWTSRVAADRGGVAPPGGPARPRYPAPPPPPPFSRTRPLPGAGAQPALVGSLAAAGADQPAGVHEITDQKQVQDEQGDFGRSDCLR